MTPRPIACLVTLALATTSLASAAGAESWSRFRGPNGSGLAAGSAAPTDLGPDSRRWETEIPAGRSSPVIGDRGVFLTAMVEGRPTTLAFDRTSGKPLWSRAVEVSHPSELHAETDSAVATAATDGANVYVFFHEAGLVSYDADGDQRWRRDLGPLRNFYGCVGSPVLARDLVLVLCDQTSGSFLVAVDSATGEPRWRVDRDGRLESYTTPVLYPATGEPRLVIVSGSRWVDAYDLADGAGVWTVPAVGSGPVASPIVVGDTLYVSAHDHGDDGWTEFAPILAEHDKNGDAAIDRQEAEPVWIGRHFGWLDNDADGRITGEDWRKILDELLNDSWGVFAIRLVGEGAPAKIWNYRQNVPYIPSPVVVDGIYYMVKDGIVTALDAASGELVKRGRLPSTGKVYASPVVAGGSLYVATLGGQIFVLSADRDWEVVAVHEIGEPLYATPAIADGALYVRTPTRLVAYARPRPAATPADGGR